MLKKIVVVGPESTGKSTLCSQLADHYKTQWCPEYAREYLLANGTDYSFEDLLIVAKGQMALENSIVEKILQPSLTTHHSPLFIDTDQYVMKVWCEYVFNDCHNWILRRITEKKYDLYLLCKPDLPWVKDELREYPNEKPRQELYHIYKDIMVNQETQWVDINGSYEERLQKAIAAVDLLV